MSEKRVGVEEDPAIATFGLSTELELAAPGADKAQQDAEADLLRAAQGDLRHFAPIYERYAARLYAYCLRRVGDAREAEDLTSAIVARALSSLHTYRGGMVAAWLFSIARSTVINHLKARGRRATADFDEAARYPDQTPGPLERVIQSEETQTIRALVAELPAEQQDMLLMKIAGGLTAEQIGQALGKKAGAVRTALSRIIRDLQRRFEAEVQDQDQEKEEGDVWRTRR
ncbi:MAG: RNA polymerase sigma factor [Anaerolineae bacterium]|nr:RNA polymerase sigma factor [Anaerolineae bacterium]